MAGSPPNLHTMVPRRARIQGLLKVKVKVKGHVIWTLVISRKSLLLAGKWLERYQTCTWWFPARPASRVWSRSRSTSKITWYGHFCDVTKCLLYSTVSRSVSTCTHFMKHHVILSFQYKYQADIMSKYWNELLRHWRSGLTRGVVAYYLISRRLSSDTKTHDRACRWSHRRLISTTQTKTEP